MNIRHLLGWLVVAGLLTLQLSSSTAVAAADTQGQWEQLVEETFLLGRGMGRQLMTQGEWQQHREKMRTLSPEAREQYREEWHKEMVERAKERGITMPETPGPHGRGMGPGGGRGRGYIY
ncbi:MAG: hypothetical protein ACE1Z6_07305 [Candidatus Methylomirabilales bacterium]|nr:hypothetical protein [candidate division NC10 bacterium]